MEREPHIIFSANDIKMPPPERKRLQWRRVVNGRVRQTPAERKEAVAHKRVERVIVKEIMIGLREMGCKPVKNHGTPYSRRGRPDIEVAIRFKLLPFAVPFSIEVKREKGELRTQQRIRLKERRANGEVAIVATSWVVVERAIRRTRRDITAFFQAREKENDSNR